MAERSYPFFVFRICLVYWGGRGRGRGRGGGRCVGRCRVGGSSMCQKCIMMCIKILDFTTIRVSIRILSHNLRGRGCVLLVRVCVRVLLVRVRVRVRVRGLLSVGCVGNIRGCII